MPTQTSIDLIEKTTHETYEWIADVARETALEDRYYAFQALRGVLQNFFAEQNARLAKNAEEYYRSLFGTRASSWNLRDRHMAETLDALLAHLDRTLGTTSKAAVWAHNSHVGDARFTEMGARGELNIGQLARERYGVQAVNIGFTTYRGTVTAADNWDELPSLKIVRPAFEGSYEEIFHRRGSPQFVSVFDPDTPAALPLPKRALVNC